jgi:hypothetical protein
MHDRAMRGPAGPAAPRGQLGRRYRGGQPVNSLAEADWQNWAAAQPAPIDPRQAYLAGWETGKQWGEEIATPQE